MQPTRPATATITTALAVFLLANLAVAGLAVRSPQFFPGWPTREMAVKAQQMRSIGSSRRSVDVVFIGDSVVAVGVDPAIVMSSQAVRFAYNAATLGSVPETWAAWVPDVVVPFLHPRTVMIFVGPRNLVTNENPNDGDRLRASEAMRELAKTDPPLVAAVKEAAPIIRYRDSLANAQMLLGALDGWSTCVSAGRCLSDTGFSSRPYEEKLHIPPRWVAQHTDPSTVDLSGRRTDIVIDLVRELRAQGVGVVVVGLPQLISMRPVDLADPDVQYPFYEHELARIADQTGVEVWDANDVAWSEHEFADPLHLNGRGIEKLAVWLAARSDQSPTVAR